MLKKTITYNDYNGVERTEDLYFNLSEAELMEMEMSTTGGLADMLNKIVAAKDLPALVTFFKSLVLKAYGEKSADGKRFIKTDKDGTSLSSAFAETEAYSIIFMELATDDVTAANFVNGIIPANLDKRISQKTTGNKAADLPNS